MEVGIYREPEKYPLGKSVDMVAPGWTGRRPFRPGGLSYPKKAPRQSGRGAMKVYYNLSRRMTDQHDAIINSSRKQ